MSTVDEIKAAALQLTENEQVGLYRWLDEAEAVRRWKLADLQREIAIGLQQLERGESATYDDASLSSLVEDISRRGRARLQQVRK